MEYEEEHEAVSELLKEAYTGENYWYDPRLVNETIKAFKLLKDKESS